MRDKDGCALHGNVWCTCYSVSQFKRDLEKAHEAGEKLAKEVMKAIARDKRKRRKAKKTQHWR